MNVHILANVGIREFCMHQSADANHSTVDITPRFLVLPSWSITQHNITYSFIANCQTAVVHKKTNCRSKTYKSQYILRYNILTVISSFIIIPAKARDYVFTGVGLSVCLSVCLFVTTITK